MFLFSCEQTEFRKLYFLLQFYEYAISNLLIYCNFLRYICALSPYKALDIVCSSVWEWLTVPQWHSTENGLKTLWYPIINNPSFCYNLRECSQTAVHRRRNDPATIYRVLWIKCHEIREMILQFRHYNWLT